MVDKNKAIELRKSGMKYKDIAKELQCSEVWCKKNLFMIAIDNHNNDEQNSIDIFLKIIKKDGRISYEDTCNLFYNKGSAEMTKRDKAVFKQLRKKLRSLIRSDSNITSEIALNNTKIVARGGDFEVYRVYSNVGELLYVGSGRLNRHFHVFSGRSHVAYLNRINTSELQVIVDQSFKTKEDSLKVEMMLISTLFPPLNDRGNWKNQFITL